MNALTALVWDVRRTCALGRVLVVGDATGALVRAFTEEGVNAAGADTNADAVRDANTRIADGCRLMTGGRIPYDDASFETVVGVGEFTSWSDAELTEFATELRRVTRRHVALYVPPGPEIPGSRQQIDERFIAAGFRRHPQLLNVVTFEALEHETAPELLLYERIADVPMAVWPIARLSALPLPRTDMLRAAGRTSDAHLQRYTCAAGLIRQNDVVLDLGCGTGDGVATLAAAGRAAEITGIDDNGWAIDYARELNRGAGVFRVGDIATLDGIADQSVHLVTAFDVIQRVEGPPAFLAAIARVLAPGGRVVASVPCEWLDDTGRDPDPRHTHVFDADRFLALFDAPFLVEHVFNETAGGGPKRLRTPVRSWRRLEPSQARHEDAEWWVVVAMKDPQAGAGVPYVETVHAVRPGVHRPASVSYPDAYENPWLRNAIVSLGIRLDDQTQLGRVAARTEVEAAPGSIDQGAAICVGAYQDLQWDRSKASSTGVLLSRIDAWLAAAGSTPHHERWRISLEFVAARLALRAGRRDDARRRFDACAGRDALAFSPLLATKTVEAAYMAGLLYAWDDDHSEARRLWSAGLRQAGRACAGDWWEIVGDTERPFTFGLRELSQVLDQAARCGAGLNALEHWYSAPGRLAELLLNDSHTERDRIRDLSADRERAEAVTFATAARLRTIDDLETDITSLREQLHDAHTRLAHVRTLLADRAPRGVQRVAICRGDERTRALWEALAARPDVDVVALIDDDPRARPSFGVAVHGAEWLQQRAWDRIAVLSDDAPVWRSRIAALGIDAAALIAFDGSDASVFQDRAASVFPDRLADTIGGAPAFTGLRLGIFGTGSAATKVWEVLADIDDAEAAWFADNNPAQQGREVLGLRVIAPAAIAREGVDAVVIGSMSRTPIREQLLRFGVAPGRILTPDVVGPLDQLRRQLLSDIHRLQMAPRTAGVADDREVA